jgi:hypothetical protein
MLRIKLNVLYLNAQRCTALTVQCSEHSDGATIWPKNIYIHFVAIRSKDCLGDKIDSEMGGACSAYVERRGVCRVLVGKPEEMRLLERPRRR